MSLKTVCQVPYGDVCVAAVEEDERTRRQRSCTLSKGERFPPKIRNGNMQEAVPDITDPMTRARLPSHWKVDSNTRTIFSNDAQKYDPPAESITEHIKSPQFRSVGCQLTGHKGMDQMAPDDPRVQNCKSPSRPEVGPGFYRDDPLWDHTCAVADFRPGDSHHMMRFSKDPTRASPAFRSTKRYEQHVDKAALRITDGMAFLPHDYKSWTSHGFPQSRQARVIEAERWGKTVRDVQPKASDRPQGDYEPHLMATGRPSSTAAYLADRDSMRYKPMFESGMPRLVAISGGQHKDSRIVHKDHERMSTTPSHIGPGAYSLEPPRFRSFNSAFDGMANYTSLGSRSAVVVDSRAGPSPGSTASSGIWNGPQLGSRPGAVQPPDHTSETGWDSTTPKAPASCTADMDWMVHQMLATGAVDKPEYADADHISADDTEFQAAKERLGLLHMPSDPEHTEDVASGYWSAPTTPVAPYPPMRNGGRFGKLGFLRRSTPYKSLIKSSLQVSDDLKHSRALARQVTQYC